MENVFDFRDQLVSEYSTFPRSFSKIAASDIYAKVEQEYSEGRYWPEPLIQTNPNYRQSSTVQQLVAKGVLHAACSDLFKAKKPAGTPVDLFLYAQLIKHMHGCNQAAVCVFEIEPWDFNGNTKPVKNKEVKSPPAGFEGRGS